MNLFDFIFNNNQQLKILILDIKIKILHHVKILFLNFFIKIKKNKKKIFRYNTGIYI